MCKECYNSEMGQQRRKEQNEAAAAFKSQKFKGYQDPEYLKANQRVIDAGRAMQQLHTDYWLAVAREQAQARNGGFYIMHADRRGRGNS